MPDAPRESGQALEKAQNGNGQLLEKVGMDLGLAPRPLGFGAISVWGWRYVGLGLAPRRLGLDGTMLPSQRLKTCIRQNQNVKYHPNQSFLVARPHLPPMSRDCRQ